MKRSVILIALGALGCGDPLVDPATVIGPRIVGARVRAADDAASAEPRAGQAGSIDWLVVSDAPGELAATAAFCVAEPSSLGAPRCRGAVFDERSVELRFGEPLTLDFSLPAELAEGGTWLAWLGSCQGEAAAFDATQSSFSCAGDAALSAFYRGRVPTNAPNHNPVLADDELSLGGEPWLPSDATLDAGAPCAELALPSVHPGEHIEIGFELGVDDRETLPEIPDEYAAHDRESLVYTHLATLPGLDRAVSALDFDSDATAFSVPFDVAADTLVSAGGAAINFFLLVRDERGGVDWSRRDACLVPSASGGP